MNRVTLAVVAVLLAVPAVAQAKAGIEFPTEPQAKTEQSFTAFIHGSGGGGTPDVTFRNQSTGQVLHVRTSPLNRNGVASGTVVFPDRGPWTATLSLNGKVVSPPGDGQGFAAVLPPAPPAQTPPVASDSDDGPPAWLLTIPAALIAAFGIWYLRRRPRELGT
ncbi:MAG TPA: hypothetical protein VH247_09210 [Thermoleophilaceae bacterium]|jgi:hypothetical protein|nr:hypothetical protein [Thermoleophilaceae bacterium]